MTLSLASLSIDMNSGFWCKIQVWNTTVLVVAPQPVRGEVLYPGEATGPVLGFLPNRGGGSPPPVWPAPEPSAGPVLWPGVPGHRDEAGLRGTHHTISRSAHRAGCSSGSRLPKGSILWVSRLIPSVCSSLLTGNLATLYWSQGHIRAWRRRKRSEDGNCR